MYTVHVSGQGRAGRAGQGRAGQGRAGQGRAGQGRAGPQGGAGGAGRGGAGGGGAGQGRAGQGIRRGLGRGLVEMGHDRMSEGVSILQTACCMSDGSCASVPGVL